MIDGSEEVAARATARLRPSVTTVVAVAGPVAVGKSTLAEAVADALRRRGSTAAVVSTDGFLLPTAELAARGLAARKGFPESYDVDALRDFLAAVRDTHRRADVSVPVYSHETYDIVPGERLAIPPTDALVLEGLNALYADRRARGLRRLRRRDLSPVIEQWYVDRFVHLCATATPGSFYTQFAGMDRDALGGAARSVYRSINLPNLLDHIRPSRALADVVVEKRADHGLGGITEVGQP